MELNTDLGKYLYSHQRVMRTGWFYFLLHLLELPVLPGTNAVLMSDCMISPPEVKVHQHHVINDWNTITLSIFQYQSQQDAP